MAKFLRTTGISYKIEDIIVNAKKELVIISPYLKISNNLFERLKEKSEEGVRIDFVYGKSELLAVEKRRIESLKTINLYYHENLHAKCYYNECEMIITSMNLYEFSEKNNREMGVLINKVEDAQIYEDGAQEAKSIMAASKSIIFSQSKVHVMKPEGASAVTEQEEPLNLTTIQKLLVQQLSNVFPDQSFECLQRGASVYCQRFFCKDISVDVLPGRDRWRIDIRLNYSDWKMKTRIYDALATLHNRKIEGFFPAYTVNWGSQMKRIKIDIYQNEHPDFFKSDSSAIEGTINILKLIKSKFLPWVRIIADVIDTE